MSGGVFLFFDGQAIGKAGQYMFIPQRIEFRSSNTKLPLTIDEFKGPFYDKSLGRNLRSNSEKFFRPRNLMRPGMICVIGKLSVFLFLIFCKYVVTYEYL